MSGSSFVAASHPQPVQRDQRAIRALRQRMSRLLAAWGASCWALGLTAILADSAIASDRPRLFASAVGAQFVLWGLINLGLAMFGLRQAARARQRPVTGDAAEREARDDANLARLLVFSGRLNWVWISTGLLLVGLGVARGLAALPGHGAGILVQGVFLLWFDRHFLSRLRTLLGDA